MCDAPEPPDIQTFKQLVDTLSRGEVMDQLNRLLVRMARTA